MVHDDSRNNGDSTIILESRFSKTILFGIPSLIIHLIINHYVTVVLILPGNH